jgi:hypothetical protein
MTDHIQPQRLADALDKAHRELEEARDIIRAAQRLYDEIHLAGMSTVQIRYSVDGTHTRLPNTETTTITGHGPGLPTAIENLHDALRNHYDVRNR